MNRTVGTGSPNLTSSVRTEPDLLRRARGGDPEAWRELTERYTKIVRARTRSCRLQEADAQDVMQSTWLRLAENLGRIRTPEALPGWLATVAVREAMLVARRRAKELPVDDVRDIHGDDDPQDEVVRRSEQDTVRAAVATLTPARQALVNELFSSDPAPYATIAERLGVPIGSLGPTRARALAQLRLHLRTVAEACPAG